MQLRGVRVVGIVVAALLLITGGIVGATKLFANRVDNAIPQTDLFGSDTPSVFPGTTTPPAPTATPTVEPGRDIKGPLNILIVGVDTREGQPAWTPRADAIMIMHVSADHKRAWLTSLPRDLVVSIPAFTPARYGGGRARINSAMAFGSRVPGTTRPNPAQGFQLLAKTVSMYTGIARFDAGAILTFAGLRQLVNVLGYINFNVDMRVVSIHMQPNGQERRHTIGAEHNYTGPQMVYNPGPRRMTGWQALDYARQRYLPGGDYTRARHQRQLIKATMARIFEADMVTNPARLNRMLTALGKFLTFDGRGHKVIDFAFALKDLRASNVTMVSLPGHSISSGGSYGGEALNAIQSSYFAALRGDRLDAFLRSHPSLVHN